MLRYAMFISWRINDTAKYANSANNGAREMTFHFFNGGEQDEHSDLSLVELFKLFAMQDVFLSGTEPFDRV